MRPITGESPLERQLWLYRELYSLPCHLSDARIILSTSDVSALTAPSGLASLVDDELFWSKRVTPILDAGSDDLIILAAPTPIDLARYASELGRRAQCEFLPPATQIILPTYPRPFPRWFRYPHCETLQPLSAVLRAIRIVLRDVPRTYPT
ncbi:hypothetical protein D7D52_01100 [Nocardia yunnanensis]|uniref:Uncharacterized protein n=2 Tax=Nocardia yunnanensis TaxID=2382165 RepID=A0A386Z4J6_9NOCA|nr:hypothetical protein D7D52_01100 [Nocardia yunnanensis]